jgi:hypothetical protein
MSTARSRRTTLLLAITMTLGMRQFDVNDRRIVSDAIQCKSCRVRIERVAQFGDSTGPGTITQWGLASPVRDSRGRYYVTNPFSGPPISVFDARGRFMTAIGRRGRGPGEFMLPVRITTGPEGSLIVFDRMLQLRTVLSKSYEVIATLPFPFGGTTYLPKSLFGGIVGDRLESRGNSAALHWIDSAGQIVQSLGTREAVTDKTDALEDIIGAGDGGTIWVGKAKQFVFECWDTSGKRCGHLVREAAAFQPWAGAFGDAHLDRPKPALLAIQANDGVLWYLVRVADEKWKPRGRPSGEYGGQRGTSPEEANELYDTILEIVDPRTGALLVQHRFGQHVIAFAGPGLVYGYSETAAGVVKVDIWHLKFER